MAQGYGPLGAGWYVVVFNAQIVELRHRMMCLTDLAMSPCNCFVMSFQPFNGASSYFWVIDGGVRLRISLPPKKRARIRPLDIVTPAHFLLANRAFVNGAQLIQPMEMLYTTIHIIDPFEVTWIIKSNNFLPLSLGGCDFCSE